MGSLRFADIQTRPTEVLDFTSLTVDEFHQLVPPFEAAFQAHMAHWRLEGQPRTARRYTTYTNCPLPTPEDRLLFIRVYVKTYPLQIVQGGFSEWVKARLIRGFMSAWSSCERRCGHWGMPPAAPWPNWRSASGWPRWRRLPCSGRPNTLGGEDACA